MTRQVLNDGLRGLMAAWLLAVTAFPSSVIAHSHSGGERLHHHGENGCDVGRFATPLRLDSPDDLRDREACLAADDFHRHGYFGVLGVAKYLPSSGEPCGSECDSPCYWEVALGNAASPCVPTGANGAWVGHWGLAGAADDLPADGICPIAHDGTSACSLATSPLCDRARHERSGVQLA
jgi:hypothetical protein